MVLGGSRYNKDGFRHFSSTLTDVFSMSIWMIQMTNKTNPICLPMILPCNRLTHNVWNKSWLFSLVPSNPPKTLPINHNNKLSVSEILLSGWFQLGSMTLSKIVPKLGCPLKNWHASSPLQLHGQALSSM